jgi:hypothetical protein
MMDRRPTASRRTALFAGLLLSQSSTAFQSSSQAAVSPLSAFCQNNNSNHPSLTTQTRLDAKKKTGGGGGGGGFGSSGGFGGAAKKKSSSVVLDPSKNRSVSGYTGSGTKVLATAANNFDRIRKLFGKTATTDVYVRSPLNDESVFWFVGKVIRMITDQEAEADDNSNWRPNTTTENVLVGTVYPTEVEAILSQKRLILEYAKNQLRPQNMGGPYSSALELWSAPGDSEMDVVQNKIALVKVDGSSKDLREGFHVKDVGYNPEIYVGDEKEKGGLRVVRDAEGRPVKPAFDI